MKCINTWSFQQYKPFCWYAGDIYINRIVPGFNNLHIEWSSINADEYEVYYRIRNTAEFTLAGKTTKCEFDFENLGRHYEYEFYVASGNKKSRVRLARISEAIGTVINYLHPEDEIYIHSGNNLCSPSIVRHPDGYLLCSMDIHGGGAPQNLTIIFRSDDDGKSWHYVSELMPCYWGKLFIHKGDLYMYATSTEYGDLLIGKSTDGGKTFGTPTVLGRGSGGKKGREGFHKNVENMMIYNGRIYLSVEWGCWANHDLFHAAAVISCDVNADLLDPESWHITPPLKYDPTWPGTVNGHAGATLEGTLVVAPDGNLYNIMRYSINPKAIPNTGLVLSYKVNAEDPDAPLEYSHSIKFNGNDVKFVIQKDEETGYYYSIINYKPENREVGRSIIAL
ncbi:MAG: exo-alpha-sialidase, partial [Clostridia bacterium]|nr:exo-alpha-sialidase [Clostridia bacterium]